VKDKQNIIVLILLFIFHILNNLIWFKQGFWPVGKDWHMHLNHVYALTDNLSRGFNWENFLVVNTSHPPFFYWMAVLLKNLCFGSNRSLFFTPMIFFIMFIICVYGIGKRLFDEETGIAAAIICSFSPIIYQSSIQFNVDLAAAAMVSLINYMIILSDGFKSRRFSVLTGFITGLGLLTRQFVILFIIGPFSIQLIKILKAYPRISPAVKKEGLINFSVAAGLAFLISFSYYHYPAVIKSILLRLNTPGEAGGGSVFNTIHLTFYLKGIIRQIGIFGGILFFPGLFIIVKRKDYANIFLLSWFLLPFFAATLTQLKFIEYTTAYVPALIFPALLSLQYIKKLELKKYLTLSWVIFNMAQYFKEF